MNRLVYTSLSALRGAMARQASTANNLANANTVGFRAEIANQRPLWIEGQGFDARALASEEVLAADMSEGTVSETRSEERRVGKEWGRTCRSRWAPLQ